MNRRHQKVSCCSRFCLSRIWTKTWQGLFFQVLIIVDCKANPSSSLDGVTGCWLIELQMWSICHRWRCSSSLSEPFQFHPTVYRRKANCIITKDNVWKEMKDSDITVLWFLISIPKWEGKIFMATTHFISCFWVRSLLLSPGVFYLLSFIAYRCWSTKKLRKHLWFS